MISPETRAQIRRYFFAEHWKIGTIAAELGVRPDAVRHAIESERFRSAPPIRASLADPYLGFVRQTLEQHPRLRATRIHAMLQGRGYTGSVVQLRRAVARLRPQKREPFLQLHTLAGEQAQVDWAHFGHVMVGRAKRALSCFVMTLSYSRALYLEFFSIRPWRTFCAVTCMVSQLGAVNHGSFFTTTSRVSCSSGAAVRSSSIHAWWN